MTAAATSPSIAAFAPSTAGHPALLPDVRRLSREARVAHRVPCQLRTADGLTGRSVVATGETVNLSHRGLAVHVGRELPAGSRVEVLLSSLDGTPAFLYGQVVHTRRVVMGTFEVGIAVTDEFRPA